jgi:protein gp37
MPDQRQGGIAWCDETWNPIRGCTVVSPGCANCYAMRQAARMAGPGGAYAGLVRNRRGLGGESRPIWNGVVHFVPGKLAEPLHWTRPRRIFVNAMSDLFHEALEDEDIAAIFDVMAQAPQHTFQILTKRPEQAAAFFRRLGAGPGLRWPLENAWLGVSAEDQQRAGERLPTLLELPAAVRWASLEPLLGPIDLDGEAADGVHALGCGDPGCTIRDGSCRGLDWVVVGGESGPGARPCDLAWIRAIVRQCEEAGVPCFVKQLGTWVAGEWPGAERHASRWLMADGRVWVPGIIGEHNYRRPEGAIAVGLYHPRGEDPSEWPEDLRVRQWPKGVA